MHSDLSQPGWVDVFTSESRALASSFTGLRGPNGVSLPHGSCFALTPSFREADVAPAGPCAQGRAGSWPEKAAGLWHPWSAPHLMFLQVKQLRLEREREKAMREQELEMLQREKEAEHFKTWEEQEDNFHLQQAKLRFVLTPCPPGRLS